MHSDRTMTVGEVFRYSKPNAEDRLRHPYRSFWNLQTSSQPLVMLESGINGVKEVKGPDGVRMPVLALRSSPEKAGTVFTPWHDEFDLAQGKVRYFGDHRVEKSQALGETTGDVRLETTWKYHRAPSPAIRIAAPPILIFRTVTGHTASGPRAKGFVEFAGLAVMTNLRPVEQRDPLTSRHFMNYVTDLTLLELGQDHGLNWEWIDARRDPTLTPDEILSLAPEAWRAWVRLGLTVLPGQTRLTEEGASGLSLVEPPSPDAEPAVSGEDEPLPFTWVAARAVEQVLGIERTRMMTGLERDGTVLFRGTHRLGSGTASASLRVVAVAGLKAKPVLEAASRLLELEPGQIGVVVTPAALTEADIRSLKKLGSPVLVLAGEAFRAQVVQIAEQSFDGDLARLEGGQAPTSLSDSVTHG